MNHDELESQLSAMFDGELPVAQCELLSRRIDRDENLRARWSRYALMGAAMRSEPVATARSGFAKRVSAALDVGAPAAPAVLRGQRGHSGHARLWSAALAAGLVTAVAGVSVSLLREAALDRGAAAPSDGPTLAATVPAPNAAPAAVTLPNPQARSGGQAVSSYVTPSVRGGSNTLLRTELADYIVAHSAYSTPLMRRNLLSELVTSEDGLSIAPVYTGAAGPAQESVRGPVQGIAAGGSNETIETIAAPDRH